MKIRNAYKAQVSLLLRVLPEVAKEKCFALHGGTAINLFMRDMPRLSVDIDLTYVFIEDRETSMRNIVDALKRIISSIEAALPEAQISFRDKELKLLISNYNAEIKLEVNQANRGVIENHALENHFDGMSYDPFTYEDFEETRHQLLKTIHLSLTLEDKEFLLSFKSFSPDWSIYDFERFPAVQWKLQNLLILKANNPSKYDDLVGALKDVHFY